MNDEGFINSLTLIQSLRVINVRGEKADDFVLLVEFAEEALRTLSDREAFVTVRNVLHLLNELGRFAPNSEAIYQSREMKDAWKAELVAILDDLVQFDLRVSRYDVPVGYFYHDDDAVRFALRRAVKILSGYSMSHDEIEKLISEELAGEDEACDTRLAWVLQVLKESSVQIDYSGIVGQVPQFDRPKGGGSRKKQDIARAHACRRLHAALPEFAKERWAFQAHLLEWAGFEVVERYQVKRAVVGNKFRQ